MICTPIIWRYTKITQWLWNKTRSTQSRPTLGDQTNDPGGDTCILFFVAVWSTMVIHWLWHGTQAIYIKFGKPISLAWCYKSDIPLMPWHTCPVALFVHCPMGSFGLPFGRIKIHFAIVLVHGIISVGQQGLSQSWTSVDTWHIEWNALISPELLSVVHLCLFTFPCLLNFLMHSLHFIAPNTI